MLAVSAALPLITALLKRLQREFGSLCTSSDLPVNRRTHPLQPFAFCSRTLVERFALQTASSQEGIPCARLLAWVSFLRLFVLTRTRTLFFMMRYAFSSLCQTRSRLITLSRKSFTTEHTQPRP